MCLTSRAIYCAANLLVDDSIVNLYGIQCVPPASITHAYHPLSIHLFPYPIPSSPHFITNPSSSPLPSIPPPPCILPLPTLFPSTGIYVLLISLVLSPTLSTPAVNTISGITLMRIFAVRLVVNPAVGFERSKLRLIAA
jgi:hypothetical protein